MTYYRLYDCLSLIFLLPQELLPRVKKLKTVTFYTKISFVIA